MIKKIYLFFLIVLFGFSYCLAHKKDWLIDGTTYKAEVNIDEAKSRILLENGLVRRTFSIKPNCATIGLDNLMTQQNELRAIRSEAELVIDGKTYYVGGLKKQPVNNFLSEEFLSIMKDEADFILDNYEISSTKERFAWKPNLQWISNLYPWPAPGKRLIFKYKPTNGADKNISSLRVNVIYELFDGAPIFSKQIIVINEGDCPVNINSFKSEILALVETAPKVHYGEPHEVRMMNQENNFYTTNYRKRAAYTDAPRDYIDRFTQMFVVTDYAMGGDMEAMKDNPAVRWVFDHPEYEQTGIRYYGQYKPTRLEVTPLIGPSYKLSKNDCFESCTAFEMLRSGTDQERRGLEECRFWRMMSPWTQENPILMHVRSSDDESVKNAIDQCAVTGFEMVIMTFGSGFQIENNSPKYIERMKKLSRYAQSKGIALGGYSLLASRGAKLEDAAISRLTG